MRHAGVTGATSHEWARGRGNNNTNNNVNVSCQASNKSMVWMHPSLLYSVSLIIMFGLLLNNISHRQFLTSSVEHLHSHSISALSPLSRTENEIFVDGWYLCGEIVPHQVLLDQSELQTNLWPDFHLSSHQSVDWAEIKIELIIIFVYTFKFHQKSRHI